MYLESTLERALLRIYFECRKTRTYPGPGGPTKQTAYCMDLFQYLDDEFAAQKLRNQKKTETPKIQKPRK